MLVSSPYDVHEDFYKSRKLNRMHPGWRARQVLMECLETRQLEFVWELHWDSRTAILWDLAKRERIDEVKWLGEPDASCLTEATKLMFDLLIKLKKSELPCLTDLVMIAFTPTLNPTLVWWPPKLYTDMQLEKLYAAFFFPHKLQNHIIFVDKKQKVPHEWFQFKKLHATVFAYEDLMFNVTKHVLMTQYEAVPTTEIKPSDLPKLPTLLMTDQVCVFHGWRDGTLLRVKSVTGQPTYDYRVVRAQHFHMIPPLPIPTTAVHRSFRHRKIHEFMS